MKRIFLFIIILMVIVSCGNDSRVKELQSRVDSLQNKLSQTYSAGFGEMMTNIQIHHAKLWFAGKNQNWDLAQYEMNELKETFDDIQKYQKARPESQVIPMILPALDSVSAAIKMKNPTKFESSYKFLTGTCNDCHQATSHEYNVVIIPQTPPFSNQQFAKKQ